MFSLDFYTKPYFGSEYWVKLPVDVREILGRVAYPTRGDYVYDTGPVDTVGRKPKTGRVPENPLEPVHAGATDSEWQFSLDYIETKTTDHVAETSDELIRKKITSRVQSKATDTVKRKVVD